MRSEDLISEEKINKQELVDIIRNEWVNNSIVNKEIYTDIKYKNKLIDNGYTRHLLCSHLPDHDIVKKADKAGNGILNDHGNSKHQYISKKCSIYIFIFYLR